MAIILLFTLGSFAVATVLPNEAISLQEGLMKAFRQIFGRLGGLGGRWVVAGIGFAGVTFAFLAGFFSPTPIPVGSPTFYVALVVIGIVLFTGLPLLISALKQASWRQAVSNPAEQYTELQDQDECGKKRSFLEKRTKNLYPPCNIGGAETPYTPTDKKFFCFFFRKRRFSLVLMRAHNTL